MEEKGRNRKPEFFRQNASRGDVCTDSPSAAELIFVTNITNYNCGEKIVMWRNFGKNWEILEKYWAILGIFEKFGRFCHNVRVEKN